MEVKNGVRWSVDSDNGAESDICKGRGTPRGEVMRLSCVSSGQARALCAKTLLRSEVSTSDGSPQYHQRKGDER